MYNSESTVNNTMLCNCHFYQNCNEIVIVFPHSFYNIFGKSFQLNTYQFQNEILNQISIKLYCEIVTFEKTVYFYPIQLQL
jgi:hypothetical protein